MPGIVEYLYLLYHQEMSPIFTSNAINCILHPYNPDTQFRDISLVTLPSTRLQLANITQICHGSPCNGPEYLSPVAGNCTFLNYCTVTHELIVL